MPKDARSSPILPRRSSRASSKPRSIRKAANSRSRECCRERSKPTQRLPTPPSMTRKFALAASTGCRARNKSRFRRRVLARSSRSRGSSRSQPAIPSRRTVTKCSCPACRSRSRSSPSAIKPKERIDEAKISQMLARIVDEDPALRARACRSDARAPAARQRRAARIHGRRTVGAQI